MLTNPQDYKKEVLDLIQRQSTVVRIEGDVVKIDVAATNPYEISLSQIESERRILEWVSHLSVRTGVDLVTIRMFIELTLEHLDRSRTQK